MPAEHQQPLVAGRYEIEGVIATGGMGAVYRAHDRTQNRRIALKRLLSGDDTRRRTRMFEREFHTLRALKHPRIIEVYEYGIDQDGAYYTMELLGGCDLHATAPLDYRTACSYLRDVANSLALLHARGLLHRDISPRNVRITDDGRARLIDFGTLSSFGRSANVMGTAPGVPPESLCGALLDQRADLYSLGALAYWTLTRRHAYPVRSFDQLPEAWRTPLPAPSSRVPKDKGLPPLPPELDELVLALLDQNPLARPTNAAEVVARLSAIAQLPSDDEPLSAMSYLRGGQTLGRARQRAKLRRCVKSAINGDGAVVVLEAEAGMGSGRLLADLAIEARLFGATAIVVDAEAQAGAYGVVDQIARALFAIDPEKARAALGEHAGVLSRFVPDMVTFTGVRAVDHSLDGTHDPREARMRVQSALLAWFERFATRTPLVLAIRAMHRADDGSVALLSALAHGIRSRSMLLVLGVDPAAPASAALARLVERASVTLRLPGFTAEEVLALVRATFGKIHNSERLAEWMYELTSGNPQGCIDLLQHLIEQQVIRFIEGVWVLPQELSREALPVDLAQALDVRIGRLSQDASKLALALCVDRTLTTPIERCLSIARLEGIAEPHKALAELAHRGVLIAGDDDVRFSHSAIHEAVLRRLDAATRRRLHAQFGSLLEREGRDDPQAMLDAGWHLLHGGEERRGAELLADLGAVRSTDDALTDMIPALEAALEVYRRHDYPKCDQARLLTSITAAGFFTDRRYTERYGDEALEMMQDVLGLSIARRWRPRVGSQLALGLGLGFGFLRMLFSKGLRLGARRFAEAITLFCTAVGSATGLAALTLDAPRARRTAAALEPLRALGRDSTPYVLSEYARALALLPEDRVLATIAACRRAAERSEDPRPIIGCTPGLRQMLIANALYAWGALEALCESPEALRIADKLDALGLRLANLYADQIRFSYHGARGESVLADRYRKRVELFALQAGAGWLAEIWTPTSELQFYVMSRDSVGIRRVMGELDRLSAEIPSLRRHARLAHAAYHALHFDVAAAEAVTELVAGEPRSFIGWTVSMGVAIRTFTGLGDSQRARAIGEHVLSLLDADERRVTTMVAPVIAGLALLDAELDPGAAAQRIDAYLAEIGPRGGPLTRGMLHEARAQVALLAGDRQTAREQLAHVETWFMPTENPVLIARCERLRREIAARLPGEASAASDAGTQVQSTPSSDSGSSVVTRVESPPARTLPSERSRP